MRRKITPVAWCRFLLNEKWRYGDRCGSTRDREIGSEIHIEESTVKTHLKSIFNKLHAESRTEAVTVATRRGLLRHSGSL